MLYQFLEYGEKRKAWKIKYPGETNYEPSVWKSNGLRIELNAQTGITLRLPFVFLFINLLLTSLKNGTLWKERKYTFLKKK